MAADVPSPAQQLANFIAKFTPEMARRIQSARAALRKRLPTANEIVYDNYNFFVIGCGPTERPSDCILSLTANSKGLGLCFLYGAALPDPAGILQGAGNQTRFIRLPAIETLAEPAVESLIAAAVGEARASFAPSGKGKLIIQSIAAKQRPRR